MTNKRRVTAVVVIAAAAIIVAGGLMASNMGFKLNYPLQAAQVGVSNSGFQSIGLPYNRQVGIDTASELLNDIVAGGVSVDSVQKYDILSDQNIPYPFTDFPLAPGEGYLVKAASTGSYIIVGSHDPGFNVQLQAAAVGISNSGFQRYAHPYHGVSATASELLDELAPDATSIQKYDILTDQNIPYPFTDFPLVPGEAYLVQVSGNKTFVPAHY
jgi:hypothetical protein